jgi:hypothetical protein
MQPDCDHETEIAKAIDAKIIAEPDVAIEAIVVSVAASIGFVLSNSDTQFLIDYAKRCRKT